MAFSWDLITNTLGAALPLAGKALNLGEKTLPWLGLGGAFAQALGQGFGITDGGSSASSPQKGMDAAAGAQLLASFNAAGAEGAAANRQAAEKTAQLVNTNSAEAIRASLQQQNLGSMALSAPQRILDQARSTMMMNAGNQRRELMQQGASAGSSPAALAGLASVIGQSNAQALNNLMQQGASAQQNAISQAGQAFAASEQIRNADQAQRLANVKPYEIQKFGGTNLGQIGGYQQTQQGMAAAEDRSALIKAMGGQLGTQAINKPFENETARRAFIMGLSKDPDTLAQLKQALGIT